MSEVNEVLSEIEAAIAGRNCNQEPTIDELYGALGRARDLLSTHAVIDKETAGVALALIAQQDNHRDEGKKIYGELTRLTNKEDSNAKAD